MPIILLSATTVSPLNNAAIMGMKGCVAGMVFLVYVLLLIVHFRKENNYEQQNIRSVYC